MARDDTEAELRAVQKLIRDLRTGHVANARAHLAGGRHDEAAKVLGEVERGLSGLEGRLQTYLRPPLHG